MHTLCTQMKKTRTPSLFYPVAKELGISVQEAVSDAKKQHELLLHIATHYDVGAIIRMTELWCEAASFGMHVDFVEHDFPRLGEPLFPEGCSVDDVLVPQVINPITQPLIEAVALSAGHLSKPLVVGITGPYTLGSVLCGSENFMMNSLIEPDCIHQFLDTITTFLIEYATCYKESGAHGLMIAEPSIAMISPEMCREFSHEYVEHIIVEVQDENFPILYHNCGAVTPHLPIISQLSAQGFHFGSDVDLDVAFNLIPEHKAIMGNIEPQHLITNTVDSVEHEFQELWNSYSNHENFILSTGCDLSPKVLPEMIQKLFTNLS